MFLVGTAYVHVILKALSEYMKNLNMNVCSQNYIKPNFDENVKYNLSKTNCRIPKDGLRTTSVRTAEASAGLNENNACL